MNFFGIDESESVALLDESIVEVVIFTCNQGFIETTKLLPDTSSDEPNCHVSGASLVHISFELSHP